MKLGCQATQRAEVLKAIDRTEAETTMKAGKKITVISTVAGDRPLRTSV